MKKFKKKILLRLGPFLASWVIRALSFTISFKELHPERIQRYWDRDKNVIIVFWHGRLLMSCNVYQGKGIKNLISQHGDGEIIVRSMERMRFGAIRGSTTRGGSVALRNMVKALKNGFDIGITPDGPKGPRYKVQRGIIELARLSGAPIFPLSFGSSRKKVFKSWDAFIFPYPFSRGVFFWGEPVYVEDRKDRDYLEEKRRAVEKELNEGLEFVDNYFEN
jgi:hypothetical protein